jgi:hypothetical protein
VTPKDSYSSGKQDDHSLPSRPPSPSVGKQPQTGLTPDDAQSASTSKAQDPAAIAQDIRQHAPTVPRAGEIQARVTTWTPNNKSGHNPQTTLNLMMSCKALSTNAAVASMLAKKDYDQVKAVVAALFTLVGRQIIQEWSDPTADIAMRGQAWDIFLQGVDALNGKQDKLNLYFGNVLGHDKGYAQTFGAAQGFLELEGDGEQTFDAIVGLALSDTVNTNIWMGGQAGSGKIRDQLVRGLGAVAKKGRDDQVEDMWTAVITALVNAHSPGNPQWMKFPKVIRENINQVFQAVNAIVPAETKLTEASLGEALTNVGG